MFLHISKRWLLVAALTAIVTLIVAACGGGADPTAAPAAPPTVAPAPAATAMPEPTAMMMPNEERYGGTISWAWCCPNLPNLDPHFGNHMTAQSVSPAYNHLTKLVSGDTPNDVTIEMDLAKDLTFSSDGLKMTFTLHEGVKFHDIDPANGRVITAQDVKWNLERLAFDEGSAYKSSYRNVDSFEAPEPHDLRDQHEAHRHSHAVRDGRPGSPTSRRRRRRTSTSRPSAPGLTSWTAGRRTSASSSTATPSTSRSTRTAPRCPTPTPARASSSRTAPPGLPRSSRAS